MGKIFNFYANNLDKAWFDSSSLKYCECEDNVNDYKTLRVVFNNGTQYQYNKVKVQDYLMFRDSPSSGQGLNKYIKAKGYEYEKLENASLDNIKGELEFRMGGGIFVYYKTNDEKLIIKDSIDNVLLEKDVKFTQASFDVMCDALRAVGKELYIDVDYPIDEKNDEQKIIEDKLPF